MLCLTENLKQKAWSAFAAVIVLLVFLQSNLRLAQAADEIDESVGTLKVDEIYIEPSFTYSEARRGRFAAGNSFLAASWSLDQILSAEIKLGSHSLLGVPARYLNTDDDSLALVEAYAELANDYGRIRAGVIPIPFGLEGGDAESRLRFPRSLMFSQRLINLRDQGFSFRTTNERFFSEWAIHNGEGGSDLDNEMWFSFRAGYLEGRNFRAGVSGMTGRTSTLSTNPTGARVNSDSSFDINQNSHTRLANVFVEQELGQSFFAIEAFAADVRQNASPNGDSTRRLRAGHVDAGLRLGSSWRLLARYDVLDPNSQAANDKIEEATLGSSFQSRYENSVLFLYLTRQTIENVTQPVHRALLVWRITPTANPLARPL